MQHVIKGGDTLIIPEPGTSLDSHLWIVLSDPAQDHFVLLVNLTSWRTDKDQACLLDVGDHPFIKHKTCVNYAKSKHVALQQLVKILELPQVECREPLAPEILQRIRNCSANSRMELGHYQILLDQGLVSE